MTRAPSTTLPNLRTGSIDLMAARFCPRRAVQATIHPAHDLFPLWSPDGARIAFTALRELPPQLYEMNLKSAGNENVLLKSKVPKVPSGWSVDGRLLLYTSIDPRNAGDIWALPLVGKPEPFPVVRTAADERYGTLFPDGRWLAYISNETGTYQGVTWRHSQRPDSNVKCRRWAASSRQGAVMAKSSSTWRPIRR